MNVWDVCWCCCATLSPSRSEAARAESREDNDPADNGGVESGKWGWICTVLQAVPLHPVSHRHTHTHPSHSSWGIQHVQNLYFFMGLYIYIYMSVSVCEYLSVCVKAWPLMIHQLIKHRHHKRCLFHTNRRQFLHSSLLRWDHFNGHTNGKVNELQRFLLLNLGIR